MFLESYLERPRHIEIQVFGDDFGSLVHLGERDCSIQRRHQKLIEESPSPALSPELRADMGRAAVRLAAAAGYRNAGTVEFLLDSRGRYCFLEMNARLQVEHPVTEFLSGLDLVVLQLQVAAGEPLGFSQEEVTLRGAAIELRITAEDPFAGFLPATGRIREFRPPDGPGIRCDAGIASGSVVSPHYDPLLAKIIAGGRDRETARRRALRAVRETRLTGVTSTLPFFERVLADKEFRSGEFDTSFVAARWPRICAEQEANGYRSRADLLPFVLAAAAAEVWRKEKEARPPAPPAASRWISAGLADAHRRGA